METKQEMICDFCSTRSAVKVYTPNGNRPDFNWYLCGDAQCNAHMPGGADARRWILFPLGASHTVGALDFID